MYISQGPFFKKGILKVGKTFFNTICLAVVFTQLGYADSKSAPCQAFFCHGYADILKDFMRLNYGGINDHSFVNVHKNISESNEKMFSLCYSICIFCYCIGIQIK